MIAIRSFDNYIYANILLSRLREAGIDCYLKDENTVTIDPLLSPAIGGMKIMVHPSDAPRVIALLNEFENEHLKTIACPKCHQNTIQRIIKNEAPKSALGKVLYRIINGSATDETIVYRCSNCGFTIDDISSLTPSQE